jgi:hypothetical protein
MPNGTKISLPALRRLVNATCCLGAAALVCGNGEARAISPGNVAIVSSGLFRSHRRVVPHGLGSEITRHPVMLGSLVAVYAILLAWYGWKHIK